METSRYKAQYSLPEVGPAGQADLQQAGVLVVGAGGLGCPALTYLVLAGVGHVGIADHDTVELSNLPRQPLYGESDLGRNKALAAADRLKELNSDVRITTCTERLDADNAKRLIDNYDLVLDCTDDLGSRYVINDACVALDLPFVYAGIHRFEGQLSVFNYHGGPTYRCLYPETPGQPSPSCSDAGVLGTLPGILGTWQAHEAMKVILGLEGVLSGRLLLVDLLNNTIHNIGIERKTTFRTPVSTTFKEISAKDLRTLLKEQRAHFQLIDVREYAASPAVEELKEVQLPVNELVDHIDELKNSGKRLLLYCQKGQRSRWAARLLAGKYGIKNVCSLKGGVEAWINEYSESL